MEQLTGLDAMFITTERENTPMHISSLSIYDPTTSSNKKIEFETIKSLFENRINDNIPILKKRLIEVPYNLDFPYWQNDENFDINNHVKHIELDSTATWESLCQVTADLHASILDRSRPLWEAHVITNLSSIAEVPENAFAVMLKVHHSIMDGRTGMLIFTSLHSFELGKDEAVDSEAQKNEDLPSSDIGNISEETDTMPKPAIYKNAIQNNWNKTSSLFKVAGTALTALTKVKLGERTKEIKPLEKAKTPFNGPLSNKRTVDRIRLPLDKLKEIKNINPHNTLNDVALTIIGGALRKYLTKVDELPEASAVAGIPIDVRAPSDQNQSGNRFSVMNVAIRTDIESPLKRLEAVHREAKYGKSFANTIGDNTVTDVINNLYPGVINTTLRAVVDSGLTEYFSPMNNCVITNVPGLTIPAYMAEAQLVDSFGMGPLVANVGLFHTVSSTCGNMCISFTACAEMLTSPQLYKECLNESYEELLEAATVETALPKIAETKTVKAKRRSAKKSAPSTATEEERLKA